MRNQIVPARDIEAVEEIRAVNVAAMGEDTARQSNRLPELGAFHRTHDTEGFLFSGVVLAVMGLIFFVSGLARTGILLGLSGSGVALTSVACMYRHPSVCGSSNQNRIHAGEENDDIERGADLTSVQAIEITTQNPQNFSQNPAAIPTAITITNVEQVVVEIDRSR